jgi:hypothetical protein
MYNTVKRGNIMVYRVRTYCIDPAAFERFNSFFHQFLLPNQLRFGAVLVGRWSNEDKTQITAIWEYTDKHQYMQIEEKIKKQNCINKHKTESWNLVHSIYQRPRNFGI